MPSPRKRMLQSVAAPAPVAVEAPRPMAVVDMGASAIRLVVAVSQADRARFILAAAGVEVLEPDWESLAEAEIDGWICSVCDTEVDHSEDVCPTCSTHRLEPGPDDD